MLPPVSAKVVVGYDGSEAATAAVTWAAAEAAIRGRGLVIVNALLPTALSAGFGAGMPATPEFIETLQQGATDQLARIASEVDGVDVVTHVEIGSPSGVLLEASEEAELVVIGSRGRGGFSGLLLGSVSSQVAAHAQCPTVVLRHAAASTANTVVVGIDGSEGSQSAAAFAFDTASRHGWRVIALHAWAVPSYDLIVAADGVVPLPMSDVADEDVRMSAEVLSGLGERYPDVDVEQRLVQGGAVDAVVGASADAALLVVGTRGHGMAVGALLGSVSHGVLHKATCPVAVVPTPEVPLEAA
jgi:nucleotide-binding universal stress UspA family protein